MRHFKKSNRIWVFLLCIAWLFCPETLFSKARDYVVFSDIGKPVQIGPHAEYLRDAKKTFTLDDVISEKLAQRFQPNRDDFFNYGVDPAAYWIRFYVDSSIAQKDIFLYANMRFSHADFFIPETDTKLYRRMEGGWEVEVKRESEKYPMLVFSMPKQFDSSRPLYLRLESFSAWNFEAMLVEEKLFLNQSLIRFLVIGALFGILIAMALYNLILFVILSDKTYLYYVAYVSFLGLYQFAFLGYARFLGDDIWIFLESGRHVYNLGAVGIFMGIAFSREFLQTKKILYKHDVVLRIAALAVLISIPFNLFVSVHYASLFAFVIAPVMLVFILSAGILRWYDRDEPAKAFVLAWGILAAGNILFSLRVVQVVPSNFFTQNAMIFSAAVESILLSFAVAGRIRVIRQERRKLEQRGKELAVLSITDELTGLYNKRYFNSALSEHILQAVKHNRILSLALIDVDKFKEFNDSFGHALGDEVLHHLGDTIMKNLRESDIPCRFGGDEVVIIFPDMEKDVALSAAERIRSAFEKIELNTKSGQKTRTTVSGGVAQLKSGEGLRELLDRTDKALYNAKYNGRNRIEPDS